MQAQLVGLAELASKFLDHQARKINGEKKKPATIAQQVSVVNGYFDWLQFEGIIKGNPTRRNGQLIISRPPQIAPEENDDIVVITLEDVVKMLIAADEGGKWNERLAINCLALPRLAQACDGDRPDHRLPP